MRASYYILERHNGELEGLISHDGDTDAILAQWRTSGLGIVREGFILTQAEVDKLNNEAGGAQVVRDEILEGVAAIIWGDAWACHVEDCRCHNLAGVKIEEVMPPIPEQARSLALKLVCALEEANEMGASELYDRAVEANGGEADDPERFGNCLAYMSQGAGVSWFDDHEEFDFEVPELLMHDTHARYHADTTCTVCPGIKAKLVESLRARGFDDSVPADPGERGARVQCSQCESLVINGTATHESGCPNTSRPVEDLEDSR